ncbi:uncharacterized protein [Diadema antillarum]|uniref:uncharacterized protein n=1 Tax=Diadema antillarum TaxID=105358 RepID=UPI003A84406F
MRSTTNTLGTGLLSGKQSRDIIMNPTQNLMNALKSNSFSRIRSAIRMPCVDFNHRETESDCRTPLMRVCDMAEISANARRDLAKLLLAKQVDVNAQDKHGLTALAIACKAGDVGMVRQLADDADIDPNLADLDGDTPLLHATRSNSADIVNALIVCFKRFGLKVDEQNKDGVTPLMEAARLGNAEICRALVQEGQADVNIRDSSAHSTAWDYAVESGRCSTPELLLLSPVAQRKVKARQQREACGQKVLRDIIEDTNMRRPRSEWIKPTNMSVAAKYEAVPLPTEYALQANSMVFQVGKNLQRLAEDVEGEMREEAEMEEERRRAPIRRRYSLPSARHCVYGSASSKLHRGANFYNMTASGSPRLARGRGKPEWLKLPPVPETSCLSRSPSPNERQSENKPTTAMSPPESPKSSPVPSPRLPKKSPSRVFSMKSMGDLRPSTCQTQTRRVSHEPAIASGSHKRPSLRISHTWEGRPSSTVPSYLFR